MSKICNRCCLSLGILMLCTQHCLAQMPQPTGVPQVHTSTPALKYFGRGLQVPVPQPHSPRQAPSARPYQLAGGKPFQNLYQEPTVSPYLNLDAIESGVNVPNYYSRVLPQIQQQQANQAQAAEVRRLQQQLRLANAPGAVSNNRNGGIPTTGRSSQFMNVGNYFPTLR